MQIDYSRTSLAKDWPLFTLPSRLWSTQLQQGSSVRTDIGAAELLNIVPAASLSLSTAGERKHPSTTETSLDETEKTTRRSLLKQTREQPSARKASWISARRS
jgi:hypothetical protein